MRDPAIKLIELTGSSELTFKAEVNSLEFTENIGNVNCIDPKERDDKLAEIGKQIFMDYPVQEAKKKKLFEINIYRGPLSQEEIDDLLILVTNESIFHTRRQRTEENGCSLKHVPTKNRTKKLCIAAVGGGIYDNVL
jgi:hypothetical protein